MSKDEMIKRLMELPIEERSEAEVFDMYSDFDEQTLQKTIENLEAIIKSENDSQSEKSSAEE